MNEATKPLTFLPARLHLWRASDGASTHVIQARDAATQDWFIIFLFVYIFFGTSATRLPGGWDAETLAYGVTPHAFCKEVHLQSWIPASHYTDPYRLSGRSRDYFLMPARMTRLSCCRFKKPTFLLTLHPKNQMCTRGGKMVLFGVYLLLISLGSYKGRGGEERGGWQISFCQRESALTQAALTSVAAVNGGRAERQEPVGLKRSSVALVKNSKGEHLHETFIRDEDWIKNCNITARYRCD